MLENIFDALASASISPIEAKLLNEIIAERAAATKAAKDAERAANLPYGFAVTNVAERADLDALAASTKQDYRTLADAVLGLARRVSKLEAELTADHSDAPLPPDLMELVARSVKIEAELREAMLNDDSAAIAAIRKSDTRNERLILATVRRYAKGNR